jgi:hypothetical protein
MSSASYQCPECQRVSFNPHDVEQRYCGHCHVFESDRVAATRRRMTRFAEALGAALLADGIVPNGATLSVEHLVIQDLDAADRLLDRLEIPKHSAPE